MLAIDSLTITGIVSAIVSIGVLLKLTCCRNSR